MVKKLLFLVALLAGLVSAETSMNWHGYIDTVKMPACSASVTVYSKTSLSLTDYDMVRIVLHVADTTTTGFASDSVNLIWGYQSYTLCLNSLGVVDTCFSPRVLVDTCRTALYGSMAIKTLDANGIAGTPTKSVDTSFCTGYAVQSRTFSPEWDVYYRLWVTGLTGNLTAKPIKLLFTNVRRLYRGSRAQ